MNVTVNGAKNVVYDLDKFYISCSKIYYIETKEISPKFYGLKTLNKLIEKPSGTNLKINCDARGSPRPTIEWTKDLQPIDIEMNNIEKTGEYRIMIKNLSPVDSGAYMCELCNYYGCIKATTNLEVTGKN
jgi:hypothetical protein